MKMKRRMAKFDDDQRLFTGLGIAPTYNLYQREKKKLNAPKKPIFSNNGGIIFFSG